MTIDILGVDLRSIFCTQ